MIRRWLWRGVPVLGVLGLLWVGWLVFKPEGLATDGSTGPLALYKGEWSGDDAALIGTVEIDGPCFYVLTSIGLPRQLVAFSARGAEWDEFEEALSVGDLLLRDGDPYRSGGGEGPRDQSTMDWAVAPDPSCDTSHLWIAGEPHR